MRIMVSEAAKKLVSALKSFKVDRLFAAVLVGFLLLTSNVYPKPNSVDVGDKIHERLQRTDQYSERPKTTGEFLDEARGDVPLDERLHNITRDSAEAMKQLGDEYTSGMKENLRSFKDKAEETGRGAFGRS